MENQKEKVVNEYSTILKASNDLKDNTYRLVDYVIDHDNGDMTYLDMEEWLQAIEDEIATIRKYTEKLEL